MDLIPVLDSTEDQPQSRLPWHKPEIQQITVRLDTAGVEGSNIDSLGGSEFTSDLRLKQDIAGIGGALPGVLSLRGVTFRYDTTNYPELGLSDQPQIGFLAQELEQVYPQVVTIRKDGFKAVNYALLVPVLVEAIKQQQEMIAGLQDQLKDLR